MSKDKNEKTSNDSSLNFDKIMHDLMDKSAAHLLRIFEYISFGILIALFSYGKPFIAIHKLSSGLCFTAALLSIISIFTYFYRTYKMAEDMLTIDRGNNHKYIEKYKKLEKYVKWAFFIQLLSILCFINVSLMYFFEYNIICTMCK